MNINDILTLAKAGFTSDQIMRLVSVGVADDERKASGASPEPASNASPAPAPAPPEPAPAPAPQPMTAAAPEPAPGYADLLAAINGLNSTIKKSNISASSQPAAPTVDDILAEIINPPGRP